MQTSKLLSTPSIPLGVKPNSVRATLRPTLRRLGAHLRGLARHLNNPYMSRGRVVSRSSVAVIGYYSRLTTPRMAREGSEL